MIHFQQKWVHPELSGCLLPPPPPSRPILRWVLDHEQLPRPRWTRREAAKPSGGPGAGGWRPNSPRKRGQTDKAGASGARRGHTRDGGKHPRAPAGEAAAGPRPRNKATAGAGGAEEGRAPARTRTRSNITKSTGAGQITATACTRPGTQGGADTAVSVKIEQTGRSRGDQSQAASRSPTGLPAGSFTLQRLKPLLAKQSRRP